MIVKETKETEYQKSVHRFLSDPSKVMATKSGKRLQILSPGRHNVHEGPDFLDIAILLNGFVIVGDGEFHFKSSDWKKHSHSNDPNYDRVILHIVLNDDSNLTDFETLVIDSNEVLNHKESIGSDDDFVFSIDELQNYSLLRLLRKTAEAQKILKHQSLDDSIKIYTAGFLNNYANKRRRPAYNEDKLVHLIDEIDNSQATVFLNQLSNGDNLLIQDEMQLLLKAKISNEGANLRREIILNCILPIALCLANEITRINLFLWYWSTPSLTKYGLLNRKFQNLPQNFLWQQQGMLEYIKEHGKKHNIVSEVLKEYGFAEILDFYQSGKSPFRLSNEDI